MARNLDELVKAQLGELMWQVLALIQQNEALREHVTEKRIASTPADSKAG